MELPFRTVPQRQISFRKQEKGLFVAVLDKSLSSRFQNGSWSAHSPWGRHRQALWLVDGVQSEETLSVYSKVNISSLSQCILWLCPRLCVVIDYSLAFGNPAWRATTRSIRYALWSRYVRWTGNPKQPELTRAPFTWKSSTTRSLWQVPDIELTDAW